MTRFNSTAVDRTKTTNKAGGGAYTLSSEMELYTKVCTASLYHKYYESPKETVQRIRQLVSECNPEFVAKLAVYAREQMNLRTIPLVLTVELARVHSGDNLVSRLTKRVIQRVDELTEILSYYAIANERTGNKKLGKLSKQLEKGIAGAFTTFDEHQFGKYDRDNEVKLRDALFLSHAKPVDEAQKTVFTKIVEGNLATPYTWETRLSEAGQNGETKKDVWEELIASRKVGYMALLRNLRNIIQADVSNEHITMVCDYLSNEVAVKNSKQLPFRFLSAYRMLSTGVAPTSPNRWNARQYEVDNSVVDSPQLGRVLEALEAAIVISAQNIPMFQNENVLIATDVSGSMIVPVSPKSVITRYDIGSVLAMLVHYKAQNTVTGMFGDTFRVHGFPKTGILRNAEKVYELEGTVGYATHGYKVLEYANGSNASFDKIMIFTDCQMYGHNQSYLTSEHSAIEREWKKYKQNNPNAKLYLFDLAGYGTSPVTLMDNDVTLIAGWSDKVFDVMNAVDAGDTALDVINSIEL